MTEVKVPADITGPDKPETAPAVDPNRPSWLPEKFETPEAMAASYAELEAKMGAPKEGTSSAPEKGTETAPTDTPAPDANAAKEAVDGAGLDFAALSSTYAEKGELPAEDMAKLEAAGISKEMVDQYIAGQKAQADAYQNEITADVGGMEAVNKMIEWAGENLTEGEITAYNKVMESGDKDQTKIALAGLKARFDGANGVSPKLTGGKTSTPQTTGFRSKAEMTAAMGDRRYQTDPAYRDDVARKLAHTDWL